MKAVLSYYTSTITVNSEGDAQLSDETLEGLGRVPDLLFALFGAIITIAQPPKSQHRPAFDRSSSNTTEQFTTSNSDEMEYNHAHFIEGTIENPVETIDRLYGKLEEREYLLTDILPDPGYYVAGALAGAISRTSTAPLDRLKVFLIASVKESAAKTGATVVTAAKFQPLIDATKELWRAGGYKNLWAGEFELCDHAFTTLTFSKEMA